ncbi:MAG: hypothetical protein RR951_10100 [Ruthenibacterium sp.]
MSNAAIDSAVSSARNDMRQIAAELQSAADCLAAGSNGLGTDQLVGKLRELADDFAGCQYRI